MPKREPVTVLERTIEKAGNAKASRGGWDHVKVGHSGWPDQKYWQRRVHVWIEYKTKTGKLTALQEQKIKRLEEAGEFVYVSRSANETMMYLNLHAWWLNQELDDI